MMRTTLVMGVAEAVGSGAAGDTEASGPASSEAMGDTSECCDANDEAAVPIAAPPRITATTMPLATAVTRWARLMRSPASVRGCAMSQACVALR